MCYGRATIYLQGDVTNNPEVRLHNAWVLTFYIPRNYENSLIILVLSVSIFDKVVGR